MLTGKNSVEKKSKDSSVPVIKEGDCLENFGIFSLWYQNFCYTDGQYNYNNFQV